MMANPPYALTAAVLGFVARARHLTAGGATKIASGKGGSGDLGQPENVRGLKLRELQTRL